MRAFKTVILIASVIALAAGDDDGQYKPERYGNEGPRYGYDEAGKYIHRSYPYVHVDDQRHLGQYVHVHVPYDGGFGPYSHSDNPYVHTPDEIIPAVPYVHTPDKIIPPIPYVHQTDKYPYNQEPDKYPYNQTPDKYPYNQTPDKYPYNQSPDNNAYTQGDKYPYQQKPDNGEHILSNEIFNQNQYEIPRPEVLLQYGFPEVGGQPNIKKRKSNK